MGVTGLAIVTVVVAAVVFALESLFQTVSGGSLILKRKVNGIF